MEKAKRRQRLGAAGWQAALKRFDESGLSVQAFCEREGLGTASLYRWRTRLAAEPDATKSAMTSPNTAPRSTGFVDLGTLSTRSTRLELRVDLGAGVVMHLIRG